MLITTHISCGLRLQSDPLPTADLLAINLARSTVAKALGFNPFLEGLAPEREPLSMLLGPPGICRRQLRTAHPLAVANVAAVFDELSQGIIVLAPFRVCFLDLGDVPKSFCCHSRQPRTVQAKIPLSSASSRAARFLSNSGSVSSIETSNGTGFNRRQIALSAPRTVGRWLQSMNNLCVAGNSIGFSDFRIFDSS
jgi:hypothetical protein